MKNNLLLFLVSLLTLNMSAQSPAALKLSGRIIEKESSDPIPYVNILLEGTGRGTVSNALGEFEINANSLPVTLEISHVGFKGQSLKITTANNNIEIALEFAELQGVEVVAKKRLKFTKSLPKP
ncbi:MAG: carboxypeptidase-like regulatory domain-containing protein [Saprospiraceae bacterium]